MGEWFGAMLINCIILGPLAIGAGEGYLAEAKKRYYAGTPDSDSDWIPVFTMTVVFYLFLFFGYCWLMKMPLILYFFKYAFIPLVGYAYWCKKLDKDSRGWKPPVSNGNDSKPSSISKFIDIFDTGRMWKVVTVTLKYGSPLVCFGAKYDADPHNDNQAFTDEEKAWSYNVDKVRVTNEDRGLVVGMSGSGKTTYLIAQLIDWMKSGKSFVATDIKPEIWAILKENGVFERYGYTDWVINPTDTASHHYNILAEATSSADINEILTVIIPTLDPSAEVFAENARRLLKAVIIELGDKASLSTCQRYINNCDDVPELLKQLRKSDNETVAAIAKDITRTAKNENLLSSIMTSLNKAFIFLDDERIRQTTSRSDLSLKEILVKKKQAVILQFDQEYQSTTAILFGAMVSQTFRILQSNYRKRDEVLVTLDEIINCAPIPRFLNILNTVRSAKIPTFLYLQALEGLNRIYGNGADRLFMGACDFKAVFKISDIETAKVFSDLIGVTEGTITNRSSTSASSNSAMNERGMLGVSVADGYTNSSTSGKSTSVVTQMMQVIDPDQFTKLKMCQAVCIYRGQACIFQMPMFFEDYPSSKHPQNLTMGQHLESLEVKKIAV